VAARPGAYGQAWPEACLPDPNPNPNPNPKPKPNQGAPHVSVVGAMGAGFGVSAQVTGAAGGLAAAAAAAAQERRASGGGAASWSCGASTPLSPLSKEASGSPLGHPGTSPRSPRTSSLGGSSPSRGGFSLMPTTPEPASPHRSAGYSPPSSRQGQRAVEGAATESPQPTAPPPQHEVEQAEEEI